MYRWTVALRDALIEAEVDNIVLSFTPDDVPEHMTRSMVALASIPIGGELVPTGDEVERDEDVKPAPTWEWVNQLVQFYYGNGPLPS